MVSEVTVNPNTILLFPIASFFASFIYFSIYFTVKKFSRRDSFGECQSVLAGVIAGSSFCLGLVSSIFVIGFIALLLASFILSLFS